MPQPPPKARVLSPWLIGLGSAAIALHLTAVVVAALAAPSGPWVYPDGSNMAPPPQFAAQLHEAATPYLKLVRMTDNYHFATNRPGMAGVYFEVRLKDETGKLLATQTFPDENANFWVRHRQTLLAQWLSLDEPVQPPQGEVIAAPGQQVQTVELWDTGPPPGSRNWKIKKVPQHLVPRDQPLFKPTEWALVLARSYARYLCRTSGAASAELIRHTRQSIPPSVMSMPQAPAEMFDERTADFGELPR